jgi:hypothetical protein
LRRPLEPGLPTVIGVKHQPLTLDPPAPQRVLRRPRHQLGAAQASAQPGERVPAGTGDHRADLQIGVHGRGDVHEPEIGHLGAILAQVDMDGRSGPCRSLGHTNATTCQRGIGERGRHPRTFAQRESRPLRQRRRAATGAAGDNRNDRSTVLVLVWGCSSSSYRRSPVM